MRWRPRGPSSGSKLPGSWGKGALDRQPARVQLSMVRAASRTQVTFCLQQAAVVLVCVAGAMRWRQTRLLSSLPAVPSAPDLALKRPGYGC